MILMCVVYIKIKSYKCNIDSENTASPEVRKYKCFTFTVSQKNGAAASTNRRRWWHQKSLFS